MTTEAKELYFFTKDHFEHELKKIHIDCVAPLIVIRQTVKRAMEKYVIDYCENGCQIEDVFSEDDFKQVCDKIYNDIINK